MICKLRLPLVLFALAILSSAAHAQAGVYAMFTVDRLSGIQSSPLTAGLTSQSYNNQVNPLGFTGGAYYDLKSVGPVRLGVDLRGSVITTKRGALVCCDGAGTRISSGLGGIRASFHTPIRFIKPYVQGSAGIGRSNFGILGPSSNVNIAPTNSGLVNNFEYHGYAGVDLPFAPFVDWRVFEAGYGALTSFGSAAHTYPIMSISTGIVIHFPSLP